jgi:hypothetical protein
MVSEAYTCTNPTAFEEGVIENLCWILIALCVVLYSAW